MHREVSVMCQRSANVPIKTLYFLNKFSNALPDPVGDLGTHLIAFKILKIQNDYPKMDFTASIIINEPSTHTEDFITVLPNKEEKTTSNSENTCLKYRFVISFCIGTVVLTGGTIGNGLATYTLWPSRMKNSTNFLLITLAFFDTCVLVVWYANTSILALCSYVKLFSDGTGSCDYHLRWVNPYFWAYLWNLGVVAHLAGTWNVVLVTFFRLVQLEINYDSNK